MLRVALALLILLIALFTVRQFTHVATNNVSIAQSSASLGDKYYKQGKLDMASHEYEKSLSIMPNRDVKFILASIYLKSGKKEKGLLLLKELSRGTDDNAEIARDTLKDMQANGASNTS